MFCIVVFDKPKMWQMICSSSKCLRHFHMPFCTSLSLSASSRVVILSLAYPCRCSDQWHHDTLRSDRGILRRWAQDGPSFKCGCASGDSKIACMQEWVKSKVSPSWPKDAVLMCAGCSQDDFIISLQWAQDEPNIAPRSSIDVCRATPKLAWILEVDQPKGSPKLLEDQALVWTGQDPFDLHARTWKACDHPKMAQESHMGVCGGWQQYDSNFIFREAQDEPKVAQGSCVDVCIVTMK